MEFINDLEYLYDFVDTSKSVNWSGISVYIWGRGEHALQHFLEVSSAGGRVEGFIDSYIKDSEERTYAGKPLVLPEEIESMQGLTIYIAPQKREYRLQILERIRYFKEKPTVLIKGPMLIPKKYNITKMKSVLSDAENEIEYVRNGLYDKYSVDVFDSLIEYRRTNNIQFLLDAYDQTHIQYFAPGIIKCNDREIFVDAGGFDGQTSLQFSRYVNGNYSKIYIMEPDEVMYQICKENVKRWRLHDVEIHNKGAYNSSGNVCFLINNFNGGSRILEEGDNHIDTISIDEMLDGKEATYIKMDIEGAEMAALEGACATIAKYMPKLAISIYHYTSDLWTIPYELMKRYPEYRFLIRHYTDRHTETVLYCV